MDRKLSNVPVPENIFSYIITINNNKWFFFIQEKIMFCFQDIKIFVFMINPETSKSNVIIIKMKDPVLQTVQKFSRKYLKLQPFEIDLSTTLCWWGFDLDFYFFRIGRWLTKNPLANENINANLYLQLNYNQDFWLGLTPWSNEKRLENWVLIM